MDDVERSLQHRVSRPLADFESGEIFFFDRSTTAVLQIRFRAELKHRVTRRERRIIGFPSEKEKNNLNNNHK